MSCLSSTTLVTALFVILAAQSRYDLAHFDFSHYGHPKSLSLPGGRERLVFPSFSTSLDSSWAVMSAETVGVHETLVLEHGGSSVRIWAYKGGSDVGLQLRSAVNTFRAGIGYAEYHQSAATLFGQPAEALQKVPASSGSTAAKDVAEAGSEVTEYFVAWPGHYAHVTTTSPRGDRNGALFIQSVLHNTHTTE